MVDFGLKRSSWIFEKSNQRLLLRSDCGSTIVGKNAGDGCREEEDEGLIKASRSGKLGESFVSRTKGDGSSGLSSNMAVEARDRRGEVESRPGTMRPFSLVINSACVSHLPLFRHLPTTAMDQRLNPKAYLERSLAEQSRPDSREASHWRNIFVHVGSISTADGSALVRLGHTTVIW